MINGLKTRVRVCVKKRTGKSNLELLKLMFLFISDIKGFVFVFVFVCFVVVIAFVLVFSFINPTITKLISLSIC